MASVNKTSIHRMASLFDGGGGGLDWTCHSSILLAFLSLFVCWSLSAATLIFTRRCNDLIG